MAHTPGKWLRSGRTVYELNEQGFNRWSAHVQDPHTPEAELEDIARLMHAAPDLLAVCKAYRAACEAQGIKLGSINGDADAALAKAEAE